jgi:hypothetical protein
VARFVAPWLAFTVVMALGLDAFVARVVIPKSAGPAARVAHLLQTRDVEEVGIFGSSRAEANFVPSLLGSHVWDYGLSGAEFDATEALLEVELAKPKTSPVIVNFDPEFFDAAGIGDVSAFVPFCSEPRLERLVRDAGKFEPRYRVPGARFYGEYDNYARYFFSAFSTLTAQFDHGAHLELGLLSPERFRAVVEQRRASRGVFRIDATKEARFRAMLRSHAERRIVLVLGPYHPSYYESFADMPRVLDWLAQLEREHPNVATISFDGRGLDDASFYDTAHLNAAGARAFSTELRGRLDARGIHL